jgi:hypothetical protein
MREWRMEHNGGGMRRRKKENKINRKEFNE